MVDDNPRLNESGGPLTQQKRPNRQKPTGSNDPTYFLSASYGLEPLGSAPSLRPGYARSVGILPPAERAFI
jgi:hypothetical protein